MLCKLLVCSSGAFLYPRSKTILFNYITQPGGKLRFLLGLRPALMPAAGFYILCAGNPWVSVLVCFANR